MSPSRPANERTRVEGGDGTVCQEDVLTSMDGWDDNFAENIILSRYWADGQGTPHPLEYHPQLEAKFIAGEIQLHRQEKSYVANAQAKAANILKELAPPVAPARPIMPGIFHLKVFEGTVTLPWSWNYKSGEEFRRVWEEEYYTQAFQDRLMGCLWWWTSKNVRLFCILRSAS